MTDSFNLRLEDGVNAIINATRSTIQLDDDLMHFEYISNIEVGTEFIIKFLNPEFGIKVMPKVLEITS